MNHQVVAAVNSCHYLHVSAFLLEGSSCPAPSLLALFLPLPLFSLYPFFTFSSFSLSFPFLPPHSSSFLFPFLSTYPFLILSFSLSPSFLPFSPFFVVPSGSHSVVQASMEPCVAHIDLVLQEILLTQLPGSWKTGYELHHWVQNILSFHHVDWTQVMREVSMFIH